jgi:hypothetical protein
MEVFYSGVVCVYKARVGGYLYGPKGGHVAKLELEVVLHRGRWATTCGQLARSWGEPTSLPRILSCHHMERYSYEGPDLAGYKVGPVGPGVGQPVALLGPPSCGFSLWGPQGQRLTVVTLV